MLSPFWRKTRLSPDQEARIIRDFAAVIPQADHRERMGAHALCRTHRLGAARGHLAGAKELCEAWASASKGNKAAIKLIEAVPQEQRGAGWTFAKARYLRAAGKFKDAAAVMAKAPPTLRRWSSPMPGGTSGALSRELMDEGDLKGAYRWQRAMRARARAPRPTPSFMPAGMRCAG